MRRNPCYFQFSIIVSFGAQYSFWTWICLDRKTRLRTEKTHFLVKKDCGYYYIYICYYSIKKYRDHIKYQYWIFVGNIKPKMSACWSKSLNLFWSNCTEHIFLTNIHKNIFETRLLFSPKYSQKSQILIYLQTNGAMKRKRS